jgi:hypothetical protein
MAAHTFEARLGRSVAIDLCLECQLFWFDRGESIQLSPASTLKLFRLIGEPGAKGRRPSPSEMPCPRCGGRLGLAHDRQRNTSFQYWRCPAGHGRLTGFFDFLREKDFIRPLSREQVEKLRRSVDSVNCSNCGAPVQGRAGVDAGRGGGPLRPGPLARQVGSLARTIHEVGVE